MSIILCMDHVWQGWITPYTNEWPPTMPRESSPVTLVLSPMSLNHAPHQCYSGSMRMIHVWICYLTVLLMLYEAWTTSDRGRSPHRPYHDLQLHPVHVQLLPWFSDKRACVIYPISPIVAQGRWHRYEYAIPLFYECYMRHGPHLTGVNHPADHIMIFNCTPYLFSYYPSYTYIAPDYKAVVAHTTFCVLVILLLVLVGSGGESLGGIVLSHPPGRLT